jgi:hypothetical protein
MSGHRQSQVEGESGAPRAKQTAAKRPMRSRAVAQVLTRGWFSHSACAPSVVRGTGGGASEVRRGARARAHENGKR